jgi:hypothetical protein
MWAWSPVSINPSLKSQTCTFLYKTLLPILCAYFVFRFIKYILVYIEQRKNTTRPITWYFTKYLILYAMYIRGGNILGGFLNTETIQYEYNTYKPTWMELASKVTSHVFVFLPNFVDFAWSLQIILQVITTVDFWTNGLSFIRAFKSPF